MIFGYALLLGLPLITHNSALKYFKAEAEQNRTASVSKTISHAKALLLSLVAVSLSMLIFVFIFKTVIGLDKDTSQIVNEVLVLDKIFK